MTATGRDDSLHQLDSRQAKAVALLAEGATHAAAADAVGVHRVTITRWACHHPEFIAELNRLRAEAAREAGATVRRVTAAALATVESAIWDGDLAAAFKWLQFGTLATLTAVPQGPIESTEVIEAVRRKMPDPLDAVLLDARGVTVADAEWHIRTNLDPALSEAEADLGPCVP